MLSTILKIENVLNSQTLSFWVVEGVLASRFLVVTSEEDACQSRTRYQDRTPYLQLAQCPMPHALINRPFVNHITLSIVNNQRNIGIITDCF